MEQMNSNGSMVKWVGRCWKLHLFLLFLCFDNEILRRSRCNGWLCMCGDVYIYTVDMNISIPIHTYIYIYTYILCTTVNEHHVSIIIMQYCSMSWTCKCVCTALSTFAKTMKHASKSLQVSFQERQQQQQQQQQQEEQEKGLETTDN